MKDTIKDNTKPGFNPFPTLKELYDQTEQFWTKPLHALLESNSLSGLMAIQRETLLSQQQMAREALEKYWEALRLPSKTDLARLAEQVVDAGNRLDNLEEQIRQVLAQQEQILKAVTRPAAGKEKA